MVFLKTLLIILLVFFGIKILAFNSAQSQNYQNAQKSSQSSKTFKSKSKDEKVGEYVDYEEIE